MEMYFNETGTKTAPTIVFINGGFTDSTSLRHQAEHFTDYHCIFADLPEYGRSRDIKPFSFEASAECVAEIIKAHANGGKAHVVGHSFGGIVVRKLLCINSELVDHAVIASANLRKSMIYYLAASSIGARHLYVENKDRFIKENITIDLIKRTFKDAIKNFKIPEELFQVETPTLLVEGENEARYISQSNQDLGKVLRNSKIAVIKNAGHNYHWDNYEDFNYLIRCWITNRNFQSEMTMEKMT